MATARKPKPMQAVLPDGLPYVPYVRVSDVNGREGESYLSPDMQLASITATAGRLGVPLCPGEFRDEDRTGSTFQRPAWERALAMVEQGQAAGVIAYNLSRMSRAKTAETLVMIEDMEEVGGQLYDEHGVVSVRNADDEMVTTVKAMIARREWRQRRNDRMKSVENAIGRGVHLTANYGYAKGPDKRLIVLPTEARQVERAFTMRADGHSWPAIATALNASGARPRPYKRDKVMMQARWTPKGVRQIVMNEIYVGVAWNGDWRTEEAHPAIVTRVLFDRANRAKGVKPQGPGDGYLLSGLIRCQGCGYVMTSNAHAGRRDYRCRSAQHGDGRCPTPASCPAEELEMWVAAKFKEEYLGSTWDPDHDDQEVQEAETLVETRKARLRTAMGLLVALGEVTGTERELVDEQVTEARRELASAEEALRAARSAASGVDLPPELETKMFENAPVSQQRLWLSTVYAAVIVRRSARYREPAAERAAVLARGDAPRDGTALRAFVANRAA